MRKAVIYGSLFFSWELQFLFCVFFFCAFFNKSQNECFVAVDSPSFVLIFPAFTFRTLFKNSWPTLETSELETNNQTFYDLLFLLYIFVGFNRRWRRKKCFYYTPKSSNLYPSKCIYFVCDYRENNFVVFAFYAV